MISKLIRAGLAASLALAFALPARADYLGVQPGGGQITVGAFAPSINGVTAQLTKSVPVDPVTGLAINPALAAQFPATLGPKAGAASLSLTPATDALFAATMADGASVALGAKGDGVYAGSGAASVVSILKGIYAQGNASLPAGSAVIGGVTISGMVPLPTGAATSAAQTTGNASLASIDGKLPPLASGRVPVDGSGVTQPVSAAALPLPTGAATAAKQAQPGTAGTPSTDVLTIQGIAGGKAIPADTVVQATAADRGTIIPVAGASSAVTAGGSGAAVGDVLTLVGGTCSVQPKFTVSAVSSGAVTAVTLNTAGSCTALATAPVATTSSGAGTGATLTPTYASIATQLMAANANRRGTAYQPQGGTLYVSGVAGATADFHSLKVPADALVESPSHHVGTGAISGICGCTVPLAVYAREF